MRSTVLLLALFACTGSITGLRKSKALADLSTDEICELSENMAAYQAETMSDHNLCTIGARAAALESGQDFTSFCESAYQLCMDSIDDDGDDDDDQFGDDCDPDQVEPAPADCTATVGDMEKCLKATFGAFEDEAAKGCSPPEDGETVEFTLSLGDVPECEPIVACATEEDDTTPPPTF